MRERQRRAAAARSSASTADTARSGFSAKTAAATTAAAREPVSAQTIHGDRCRSASANDAIEIATADAPVRYSQSICTGSRFNRCGSGSQTAPICCQPGVMLSRTRRELGRRAVRLHRARRSAGGGRSPADPRAGLPPPGAAGRAHLAGLRGPRAGRAGAEGRRQGGVPGLALAGARGTASPRPARPRRAARRPAAEDLGGRPVLGVAPGGRRGRTGRTIMRRCAGRRAAGAMVGHGGAEADRRLRVAGRGRGVDLGRDEAARPRRPGRRVGRRLPHPALVGWALTGRRSTTPGCSSCWSPIARAPLPGHADAGARPAAARPAGGRGCRCATIGASDARRGMPAVYGGVCASRGRRAVRAEERAEDRGDDEEGEGPAMPWGLR